MFVVRYVCLATALTLGTAAFCSDRDDLARAYDLQRQGSFQPARQIYEPLISRLQSGGDPALLADALRRLSEVDLAEGKYADALQHASECASLSHRVSLPAIEVDCLSVAGRAEIFSGDYPAAIATHERALALAKSRKSTEDEIALLNNIGGIYFFLGRYADAYRAYLSAQALLSGRERESWYGRRRQLTLANLATLYQQLGQYQRALDLYIQIRAAAGAMRPAEQAIQLANVGTLYRRLGDPVKAIETYRQAEQLFVIGKNRDGEIGVIRNTGIALALDMGDPHGALDRFNTALDMASQSGNRRQMVQAHLYVGETFWRFGKTGQARQHFEAALAGAQALNSGEDQWKARYGLGRIFENSGDQQSAIEQYRSAIAIIESLRSRIGSAPLQAGFLADKRDVYDSLIELLLKDTNPQADKVVQIIEGAKARTFQDRVQKNTGKDLGMASVAAKLDAGTLVLDFWIRGEKAAAVWITSDTSGITRLRAPTSAELLSFGNELANGTGDGWRVAAAGIAEKLLGPLAHQLSDAKQLIIVPDGPLQRIPFETLPIAKSEHSALLIEKLAVSYVPSVSAIQARSAAAGRSWFPPWRRELIAFADPSLPSSEADSLIQSRLANLPASRDEVRSISRILGGRSEIHAGFEDRKRYFESARLRGVPLLHLSTHAIADTDDPDRSRIVFSPDSNSRGADYLFAREISKLDLSGVRLATLAACDTEGGKTTAGEGVESFSRVFLEAGAASVVSTLWRIGDRSTSEFMKQFYTHLANGEPAVEALRQAKLSFYRSPTLASHPRFWAVFVLNGDTHSTAPKAIPWIAVLGPLALLLAILATGVFRKRGSGASRSRRSDPQSHRVSEQVRSS